MHEMEADQPAPVAEPRRKGDLVFLDIGLDAPAGFGGPPREVKLVEEPDAPPAPVEPSVDEIPVAAEEFETTEPEEVLPEQVEVVPVEGLEPPADEGLDDLEIIPVDPDLVIPETTLEPGEEPAALEGFEPGVADDTGTVPLVPTDVSGLVSDMTLEPSVSDVEEISTERRAEEPLLGDMELGLDSPPAAESYAVETPPVWEADDPALQLIDESAALDGGEPAEVPAVDRVAALEDRVFDDPDDPEAHRALGEALLGIGDHARGVEELDLALARFEELEDWDRADGVAQELARLEPSGIRYFQKLVELSYRVGTRTRVIEAYLELGDALVRVGAVEKALAVYGRVAETDPGNERALAAIDSLAPPPAAPAPPVSAPPPQGGDFVDLGAMLLDGASEGKVKDTRMRIQDEEPTGDEERDFADMLKQFKRGLDENLEDEDFQSHYDLGIAFKEMGLLDEAIAEFQKALRSPDARLRTSEALGSSFFDKGQFAVAEAILRRAVDGLGGQDDEKIGLLYWLGRALEAEGRTQDAQPYYRRALAVDIHFMDLADRLRALSPGESP